MARFNQPLSGNERRCFGPRKISAESCMIRPRNMAETLRIIEDARDAILHSGRAFAAGFAASAAR